MIPILALAPIHFPPQHMVMNDFWQPFMTYVNVVPIVAVIWLALRHWMPGERALVFSALVGGGVASLLEPMVDHLGLVFFAPEGQWTMLRLYGRATPWFILPCFVWYTGGQALLTLWLMRKGLTMKRLFVIYGAFVLSNVVMEIPAIAAGVYAYYGPQPFEIGGLPLWFQSLNAASPIVAAAVFYTLGQKRGWHPALAIAVIPGAHVLANAVPGWPMWAALNTTRSLSVTYPVALVTIGLACLLVYLVGLAVTEDAVRAAAAMPLAEAVVHEVRPGGDLAVAPRDAAVVLPAAQADQHVDVGPRVP
jgi:hypothetical protein